jgi:hypothetical protein
VNDFPFFDSGPFKKMRGIEDFDVVHSQENVQTNNRNGDQYKESRLKEKQTNKKCPFECST